MVGAVCSTGRQEKATDRLPTWPGAPKRIVTCSIRTGVFKDVPDPKERSANPRQNREEDYFAGWVATVRSLTLTIFCALKCRPLR